MRRGPPELKVIESRKTSESRRMGVPRNASASRNADAPRNADTPRTAPPERNMTQRIVESITAAIVERRILPGTKLGEQRLADIFDVSRTIVRQALNQLSRDRIVTLQPSRGAFVASPNVDEARQVFEARQLIESAMARRLAREITREQIAELRSHLRAERAAIADVPGRTRLLADFHLVMARMLGNDVLTAVLSDLLSRSSLIALLYQSSLSAEESHREHVAIVDALERGDVRAVVRLADDHLKNVEKNLRLDPRAPDLAQILASTSPE